MTAPAGSPAVPLVSFSQVAAARALLRDVVRVTPLAPSGWLSRLAGGPVLLKCENLQRAGSFKIRGAYTRISRLTPQERARGVVAASAGNHAQGVALAAQLLGIAATVFMPYGAPIPKVNATRGYGAAVRFVGETIDDALVAAAEFAERTGAVLIHPFDHPDIVAGQGGLGAEVVEQCPGVATVLVPTGGGGLLAGVATAVAELAPTARVYGVQAEQAAAYPPSLAAGHPVALARMATMADGIAVGRPGAVPFAVVERRVAGVRTVSEEALSTALLLLLERSKLVVEPAGAAAVACLLGDPTAFPPPVVCVLSGGNVDPLLLMHVVRHGMAAAGRFLAFRARVPDRPGGLAALLVELAQVGANVIEVVHRRTNADLSLDEVEVALQVETRGPEHCEQIVDHLNEKGYQIHIS